MRIRSGRKRDGFGGRVYAVVRIAVCIYLMYGFSELLPVAESGEFGEYTRYIRLFVYIMTAFLGMICVSGAAEAFLKPPASYKVSGFVLMLSDWLFAGLFIFAGVKFIYPLNRLICVVLLAFAAIYAYAGTSKALKRMRYKETDTGTSGSFTESSSIRISPETLGKIDEIDSLHRAGIISDEEYEQQKKKFCREKFPVPKR